MIGPAFFMLLDTSIRKGIRAALAFDLGVICSDIIYITIAFIFYSEVASLVEGENEIYLKLFGGLMLSIFGVFIFLSKPKEQKMNDLGQNNTFKDYLMLFVKGLILNFANPMVIFYWFSIMAIGAKQNTNMNLSNQLILFIIVLISVFFFIDVLKIIGAKKLRPFITDKLLKLLNHIIGLILILFGLSLIFQVLIIK